MINRLADLSSCHHKIVDALHAVKRIIEISNESIKNDEDKIRKCGDIKSFWCSFAVSYYSCFNDGMGTGTRNITKHFSKDEMLLHKEIEKDRNQYFCHTETHNTSRVFEVGFNEEGLPDVGIRLLSKEYAGLGKYLSYLKLAEKVQSLILTAMRKSGDAIKEKLVVRERKLSDLLRDSIEIKPEAQAKINRVMEYNF
jgi:hypothetical protein